MGKQRSRNERDYVLSSVRNAARLLSAFIDERELGVSELARRLDLAKSTVHRLLTTLAEEGFIEQDSRTGKYQLGIRLYELGAAVSLNTDLHDAATTHMHDLRETTGETVHIAVLDRDTCEVVYVERAESEQTLRLFSRIGLRMPAYTTSTGKVLLASLPPQELDEILSRTTLAPLTRHTITDEETLRRELERTRTRGYAENRNESELGVASVGAPIRDATGSVVASISVAGPTMRLDRDAKPAIVAATREAAESISRRLGYRPAPDRATGG